MVLATIVAFVVGFGYGMLVMAMILSGDFCKPAPRQDGAKERG